MRTSQYLLSTLKEIPADAEVISHQLMLRAGMIRKLVSGLYTWLPTGLRVLRKVENIVREKMNDIGAIEISMPIIQPASLWQESGRGIQYGSDLLQMTDRCNRSFVLGPTHEEVITEIIRNEISSYKQLPLNLYQIQTKFRDELRPRFGIIRSKEFVMKDAYSFHTNQTSLQTTYDTMYQAYNTIFTNMELKFRAVQADTGSIGGNISHEFHVLAEHGEDNIVLSTESEYASNIELAEAISSSVICTKPEEKIRLVDTSNVHTTAELVEQFKLPVEKTVKMLVVRTNKKISYPLIALMIRGDHQINEIKVKKLPQVATPLIFANEKEINLAIGISSRSLGPINLPLPLIIDRSVATMKNFATGANADGKHFFGVNWKRDLPLPEIADLRKVIDGDISPDGKGTLQIKRGIEIGHIFQIGTKYTEAMKAIVQDKNGHNQTLIMGCYGIGITRLIAATIEQHHDKRGILWPEAIAPFNVAILPINMHKSYKVKETAEKIYQQLQKCNIDVILDDRKKSLGVMFADMDLIGIPHIIVICEHNLDAKMIEYKNRRKIKTKLIKLNAIVDYLISAITAKE